MNNAIKISDGEWLYNGNFIQKQNHPLLRPFHVFNDTKEQMTVGVCYTFNEAIIIANKNKIKNPLHSAIDFLK